MKIREHQNTRIRILRNDSFFIMAASSLSFLGFGANVTDPEWGAMLSQSRSYLNVAPHMVYFPGLVIFVTVLAFNLFGDGLRDTLDPKIK